MMLVSLLFLYNSFKEKSHHLMQDYFGVCNVLKFDKYKIFLCSERLSKEIFTVPLLLSYVLTKR